MAWIVYNTPTKRRGRPSTRTVLKLSFQIVALLALAAVPLRGIAAQPAAHAAVAGLVVDGETGRPLQGVHVFIASSLIGTATDAEGRYRLEAVPPGAHTLYVSMLGYAPARCDTLLRAGLHTRDFRLAPTPVPLREVVVTAEANRAWRKQLKTFERLFLGESDFAADVRILNPEVLDFEARWWGKFTARASAPLVVENRALGYRVTYHLEEFLSEGASLRYDGEPLFTPLAPADEAEAARWAASRRQAYHGSFRHFMLALLAGRTEAEGFAVYYHADKDDMTRAHRRFPLDPRHLLSAGPTPSETLLTFSGAVEVLYLDEPAGDAFLRWFHGTNRDRGLAQRSWLTLTDGPALVDQHGEPVDPYGITVYGHFAFERLADLLPKEYRP